MSDVKQPLPVQGYKPQSQATIDLVNEGKALEERVLQYMEKVETFVDEDTGMVTDHRWLAIGRTGIQQGFMAVFRSVFKPGRAVLPGDVE